MPAGERVGFRPESIVELMRERDISAAELGRAIGVSRQVVSEYRRGTKTPQLATVLKMANGFAKSLAFFIEQGSKRETEKRAIAKPRR